MDYCPDIIHCHDWQTGLIPVYLKTRYKTDPCFKNTKTIFTIHNLAYQGVFSRETVSIANLSNDLMNPDALEFYDKLNFLKGGLVYSDYITTVSEHYSKEIQTKEYGCGLEGVLSQKKDVLTGIVNGIDKKYWDSSKDKELSIPFKPNEWSMKTANKGVLQKENKLDVNPEIPVFSLIARLDSQKGIDIVLDAVKALVKLDMQLIILGAGSLDYQEKLEKVAAKHPGKISINVRFDLPMAKRVYAGSDVLLVPSRYEPCGLGQMIALRYGTVPLVRATGGLVDTITDFDEKTGEGNGILFKDYTADALVKGIKRAIKLFQNKENWQKMVTNGMNCDFSWSASAKKYVDLYRTLKG